jgi:hypothetical protein
MNPSTNPVTSTATGDLPQSIYWRDHTTESRARTWFAKYYYTPLNAPVGSAGGNQQAQLIFSSLSKKCGKISWDPLGYVFDATSLDPVIGAKVTLYETSGKDAKGNFKWIVYDPLKHTGSTVKNPYITTATDPGRYSFFTEDGYYKLVVSPPAVSKIENVNKGYSAMYSDIYPALTGEIIHEEGAVEHRDVPVNSTNVASSVVVIEYTPSIVNIGEVELYGRLSHPFSKLTVMTDKLMADGTQVPYRAFDQFTADREGRFEYTVDQSTLERTDQYIEIFSYLNIEKPSAKTLSAKQSLLSKAVEYVKSLFETHAQTKTSTRIQMNPVLSG